MNLQDLIYFHHLAKSLSFTDILLSDQTDLVKVNLKGAPKFYISLVLNTEAKNSYVQQQFNDAFIEIVREIK